MITALILAAGSGVRFGSGELPKQFSEINGAPLFIHSVRNYKAVPEVDRIIVVARPDLYDSTCEALTRHDAMHDVTVIRGGDTRRESIGNAVASWGGESPGRDDAVILHNAVSPNTSPAFISACLDALKEHDAIQACLPDIRTVFESDGEYVNSVVPRSSSFYNCDPTIYRGHVFSHIIDAQNQSGEAGETTVDTACRLGYRIRLLKSDYDNIKVTNRWDLEAVRAAMSQSSEASA